MVRVVLLVQRRKSSICFDTLSRQQALGVGANKQISERYPSPSADLWCFSKKDTGSVQDGGVCSLYRSFARTSQITSKW